jgi:hypothetical protein
MLWLLSQVRRVLGPHLAPCDTSLPVSVSFLTAGKVVSLPWPAQRSPSALMPT